MTASEDPDPRQIDLEPGRLADWIEAGRELALIDVREEHEHVAGHIAGSRHLALTQLPTQASSLDITRPVVLYCRVGARSAMGAQALRGAGFEAYSMDGGLLRWAGEGRPLSPPDGSVADH